MLLKSIKLIEKDIKDIEEHLFLLLNNWDSYLKFNYREKPFRSVLFLLSFRLFSMDKNDLIFNFATGLEKINLASLLHDNITDDGTFKASLEPFYKQNNKVMILIADYILSDVLSFLLREINGDISQPVFNSVLSMCEGGLLKIKINSSPDTVEEEYLNTIRKGKASLCSVCCQAGAKFACAGPEEIRILTDYGMALGISYQIMEDIIKGFDRIDNIGDKMNLPMIHALKNADEEDRKILYKVFCENVKLSDVKYIIDKYHGIEYAMNRAMEFMDESCKEFDKLPDSNVKISLLELKKEIINKEWWAKS
jgi:octaprenyl-diphosphate synthase